MHSGENWSERCFRRPCLRSRLFVGLLVLGLTGSGCTSDNPVNDKVGRPCADSTECDGALICLTDFPDGYCTEACDDTSPCGNAACVDGVCLAYCSTATDCRDGYLCVSAGNRRACAPPGQGFAGMGDNCSGPADCLSELTCQQVTQEGLQCTKDCTSVLNCGVNAVCVSGKCMRTCEQTSDCDTEQECASTPDGRICQPIRPASSLGGTCDGDEDCEGDLTCLTDAPDGYCTKSCINQAACDGGVCHEGFCFSECTPGVGQVDILFIVDDSGGMAQFQQMLISASTTLFTGLETAGTDYRIGVVTTDVDVGGYNVTNCRNLGGVLQSQVGPSPCEAPPNPWITPSNVADPAATFACIVNALGDSGCGFEQPFEALQRAVSDTVNPGFLRSSADLIVVVVTNEDDCSAQNQEIFDPATGQYGDFISYRCFEYGIACDGDIAGFTNCATKPTADGGVLYPISRYSSQLAAVKGSMDNVTFVAVSGPSSPVTAGLDTSNRMTLNSSCPGGVPDAQPGIRIAELVDATNGYFTSICSGLSSAWGPILQAIGTGGACRSGYQCTEATEGNICEPQ